MVFEITQEAREVVPGRQYVFLSRKRHGWFISHEQWGYEPVPEGTRVSVRHEVSLHGRLKLAGPVIVPIARRKVNNDLARQKKLVDG